MDPALRRDDFLIYQLNKPAKIIMAAFIIRIKTNQLENKVKLFFFHFLHFIVIPGKNENKKIANRQK